MLCIATRILQRALSSGLHSATVNQQHHRSFWVNFLLAKFAMPGMVYMHEARGKLAPVTDSRIL